MHVRTRATIAGLAAAAASACVALTPSAAHADDTVCPSPEEQQVALEEARLEAAAAKLGFKEAQRPLGHLVKAQRHESRDVVTALQRAMKDLRAAARLAEGDDQAAAQAALADARAELRDNRSMLTSKRALLAEIKADRTEARAAWKDARSALNDLRALAEACAPADEGAEGGDVGEDPGDDTAG
jgi:multidrug efflux pump subunit AcrA (membrane-fusion protein)